MLLDSALVSLDVGFFTYYMVPFVSRVLFNKEVIDWLDPWYSTCRTTDGRKDQPSVKSYFAISLCCKCEGWDPEVQHDIHTTTSSARENWKIYFVSIFITQQRKPWSWNFQVINHSTRLVIGFSNQKCKRTLDISMKTVTFDRDCAR